MRFLKTLLLITISFYCIVIGGVVPASAQEASVVRATRVDGSVIRNDVPLKEGDIIQRDDKIIVKDKSAAVLTWSNGSMMEIYPETSVVLKGVIYEADRKMEKTFLMLEKGRIFAKAQVPEHIFIQFELSAGNVPLFTQGAEFAIKYEEPEKSFTVWSLVGRVTVYMGIKKIKIEEGQQVRLKVGGEIETPVSMTDKMKEALISTSKRLGGSLLTEEETVSIGGPLKVRIGGVKNRRGDAPYTIKFRAIVSGGSGKIKSINWSFGDGETASGKEAEHSFTQGVYVVIVRVEDEDGQKATSQITISAEEECAC